jgi:hypothetical protein
MELVCRDKILFSLLQQNREFIIHLKLPSISLNNKDGTIFLILVPNEFFGISSFFELAEENVFFDV